jgi:hypothetical protein
MCRHSMKAQLTLHFSLIGCLTIYKSDNKGARLFGMFIFTAYAAGIPMTLSMVSSNVAGFTKKATVSAMMFIAYCVGNIIGPFLFFEDEAPAYEVSDPHANIKRAATYVGLERLYFNYCMPLCCCCSYPCLGSQLGVGKSATRPAVWGPGCCYHRRRRKDWHDSDRGRT